MNDQDDTANARLEMGDSRCKAMTAAIYARKSTQSEGRSQSRDQQIEECRRDAERFGFGDVRVYLEEEGQKGDWWWRDREGRNPAPHRPELTRLMEDAERGEVQAVLVYKLDRLVRDGGVGDGLAKAFRRLGVHLVCRGRDTELSTARGLYQHAVDSAAARQWRDQISEDIKRDHLYKARRGMFSRNPSCYGFRSKGRGTQAVDPVWAELDVVERIFRLFVHGGEKGPLGTNAIANLLMEEGIVLSVGAKGHKAKDPRLVHESSVRKILANCMYAGRWRHAGEEHSCERLLVSRDGEAPRTAVPKELFDAAQAKLAARTATTRTRSGGTGHMLAGLAVCGACGRNMHVGVKKLADGSYRRRWRCPHRTAKVDRCEGGSYSSALYEDLDAWAREALAPLLGAELARAAEKSGGGERLDALERELEQARKKEGDELAALVGLLDAEQLGAVAARLRAARSALERRLEAARISSAAAEHVGAGLEEDDPRRLRAALQKTVRFVAVTAKGVAASTYANGWMGAPWLEADAHRMKGPDNRRRLPRGVGASSSNWCRTWIADGQAFVAGRRRALGDAAGAVAEEELLPTSEFVAWAR